MFHFIYLPYGYLADGVLGYGPSTGSAYYAPGVSIAYGVTSFYCSSGGSYADHFYSRQPNIEAPYYPFYTLEAIAFYAYTLPY